MQILRRALLSAPLAALFAWGTGVFADGTSQGCSSCPPADALLHKLAKRDDVIPLALHVDYWDYIGWKDQFARPEHAERQRKYASVAGRRSIYTPQMIVNGEDSIVGARGMEISDAIVSHKARETGVSVALQRTESGVRIEAQAASANGPMVVHVVRYAPERDIKITRGENAGRQISYANVVTDWRVVREWSGRRDLALDVELEGDAPVVVMIQSAGQGPIQAAAQLR